MKPIPDFLPAPDSRKWHSRRHWDGFGYFRARSLSKADYSDWPRLLGYLTRVREQALTDGHSALRDSADAAAQAVHYYVKSIPGVPKAQRVAAWDAVLEAVDAVLAEQHRLRSLADSS